MAKQRIRQFWIVSKLAVTADPNKSTIQFGDPEVAAQAVAPAPRRANPNRLVFNQDMANALGDGAPQPPQPVQAIDGYGYYITSKDAKELDKVFTTENAAIKYAQQRAEETPTVTFGVFGCLRVYETTTPSLIEKSFTADGELRLVGE